MERAGQLVADDDDDDDDGDDGDDGDYGDDDDSCDSDDDDDDSGYWLLLLLMMMTMMMILGDQAFNQEEGKYEEKRFFGTHSGTKHGEVIYFDHVASDDKAEDENDGDHQENCIAIF